METTQATIRERVSLPTDHITEAQFRIIADLCRRCGKARATNPKRHLCDQCESVFMHDLNRRLEAGYIPRGQDLRR